MVGLHDLKGLFQPKGFSDPRAQVQGSRGRALQLQADTPQQPAATKSFHTTPRDILGIAVLEN